MSSPTVLMRAKSNIGPDEGGFAYSLELVPMFERSIDVQEGQPHNLMI
jgi:hypothetical protein